MDDEVQQVTGSPISVVPTDSVTLAVSDVVHDAEDAQTREIEAHIDERADGLSTRLETVAYEQGVRLDSIPQDTAKATADELERREAERESTRDAAKTGEQTAQLVQLDSSQWQYVHDSLALQSTCQLLTLVMVCAVLGAQLCSRFLDRWRS